MPEILIKTLTRHRDNKSDYYLKDWTAGDVCGVAKPDGYYTRNKYDGWKTMGVVLLMDSIPDDFFTGIKYETIQEWDYKTLETVDVQKILTRSQKIVDLSAILTDEQLKAAFDHSIMCEPIVITQSYLDVFKDYTIRTALHTYDKEGTFDNETVDVGPAGHADANDFNEFESNIAGTLTGPVIGLADEAFQETNVIVIAGIADDYVEFKTSGAGRSSTGVYNGSDYYRLEPGNATALNVQIAEFRIDGLQIGINASSSFLAGITLNPGGAVVGTYIIKNSIIKDAGAAASDGINDGNTANNTTVDINNCVIYGFGDEGIHGDDSGVTYDIFNCVIAECGEGIRDSGAIVNATNCAVFNNTTDFSGTLDLIDYCASDAASGTNAVDLNENAGGEWTASFTDYANNDYSVKDASSLIYDVGTPTGRPATDIIGYTWVTDEIGAFAFQAAAAGRPLPQRVLSGPFAGPLGGPF